MNSQLIVKKVAEMGISDERFAADTGLSIGTIKNIKQPGNDVYLSTAKKVAEYLGIGLEELAQSEPGGKQAAS